MTAMGNNKLPQPEIMESICTSTGARLFLTKEQEEFLQPLIEHGLSVASEESKVLFLSQLLVFDSGRMMCKIRLFEGAWAIRIVDLVNEAASKMDIANLKSHGAK